MIKNPFLKLVADLFFPAKVGVCNGSFLVAKLLDSIHVEDKMK